MSGNGYLAHVLQFFYSDLSFEILFFFTFCLLFEKNLDSSVEEIFEISQGIFASRQFRRFCLELKCWGGAEEQEGEESKECQESRREGSPGGGLSRRVPGGSAKSEAGH